MPTGWSRLPFLIDNYLLQAMLSYDPRGRNAQSEELLTRLEREVYPFIVTGDFNMSEHATTYDRIAEQMQDAFQEASWVGVVVGRSQWLTNYQLGCRPCCEWIIFGMGPRGGSPRPNVDRKWVLITGRSGPH